MSVPDIFISQCIDGSPSATRRRAGFGSADARHIHHRLSAQRHGLGRRARGIATGITRHRHRGDGALGRGRHRLQRIVLFTEAKAGANELEAGRTSFEGIFALAFSRAKAGLIFGFYHVEAS